MAWLSAVAFHGGVRLHMKSITIPFVLDAFRWRWLLFLQETKAPAALRSLLHASRITVSSEYFRENISGSVLLQSSVCKANSAGGNTERSRLFCRDRSDTVCRVSIESDLLLGTTQQDQQRVYMHKITDQGFPYIYSLWLKRSHKIPDSGPYQVFNHQLVNPIFVLNRGLYASALFLYKLHSVLLWIKTHITSKVMSFDLSDQSDSSPATL